METSPNNSLEDPDERSSFTEINLLAFNSPFSNLNDNETPSDTLFGLSTHSSTNYHSDQTNQYFGTECYSITRLSNPKPFKIIRNHQKENEEMTNISLKSKKIKKQYIPKKLLKPKQEIEALLLKAPQKFIPNGIQNPDIDDRERRRLMQKLKNRLASQHTREQRKRHISELEEVKMHLEMANKELDEKNRLLNERNKELEEQLKTAENERLMLLKENDQLKQTSREDPQEYFDFSEDKHEESRFSPKLIRKQNDSHSPCFNFFLGVIMMCAISTGIDIQIQQKSDETLMDVTSKGNEPLIGSPISTELSTIQAARISGIDESDGFFLKLNQQTYSVSLNENDRFYFVFRSGYGPLRPAKSELFYSSYSYGETGLERLILRMKEPASSLDNFIYPIQATRISGIGESEGLLPELNQQAPRSSLNENVRFYFCRRLHSYGPLRSGLDSLESAESDIFESYYSHRETGFDRFIRRIKEPGHSLEDLIYLFMDLRVVLLVFLISLLLCSFMNLKRLMRNQIIITRSQLNSISDKERKLRKKRMKKLQSVASS